jgi:hypothetical protein
VADTLTTYARAWRGVWCVVAALGIGLALLETPRGIVPVAFPVVFCLALGIRAVRFHPRLRPRPWSWAFAATGALGYAALSRPVTALLTLSAVLTMPAFVRATITALQREGLLRRSPRRRTPRTSPESVAPQVVRPQGTQDAADEYPTAARLTTDEVQGPLMGLDDRQLCRLWRESLWELRRHASGGAALRLVLLRQACLDELTRRHGPGVEAWLASGARASSGPERFLEPPQAS